MCPSNSSTQVCEQPVARFLNSTSLRIQWCLDTRKEIFAHLARHKLTKSNFRKHRIDDLKRRVFATDHGDIWEAVIIPKLINTIAYILNTTLVGHGIVKHVRRAGIWSAIWPQWTERWTEGDWDGDISPFATPSTGNNTEKVAEVESKRWTEEACSQGLHHLQDPNQINGNGCNEARTVEANLGLVLDDISACSRPDDPSTSPASPNSPTTPKAAIAGHPLNPSWLGHNGIITAQSLSVFSEISTGLPGGAQVDRKDSTAFASPTDSITKQIYANPWADQTETSCQAESGRDICGNENPRRQEADMMRAALSTPPKITALTFSPQRTFLDVGVKAMQPKLPSLGDLASNWDTSSAMVEDESEKKGVVWLPPPDIPAGGRTATTCQAPSNMMTPPKTPKWSALVAPSTLPDPSESRKTPKTPKTPTSQWQRTLSAPSTMLPPSKAPKTPTSQRHRALLAALTLPTSSIPAKTPPTSQTQVLPAPLIMPTPSKPSKTPPSSQSQVRPAASTVISTSSKPAKTPPTHESHQVLSAPSAVSTPPKTPKSSSSSMSQRHQDLLAALAVPTTSKSSKTPPTSQSQVLATPSRPPKTPTSQSQRHQVLSAALAEETPSKTPKYFSSSLSWTPSLKDQLYDPYAVGLSPPKTPQSPSPSPSHRRVSSRRSYVAASSTNHSNHSIRSRTRSIIEVVDHPSPVVQSRHGDGSFQMQQPWDLSDANIIARAVGAPSVPFDSKLPSERVPLYPELPIEEVENGPEFAEAAPMYSPSRLSAFAGQMASQKNNSVILLPDPQSTRMIEEWREGVIFDGQMGAEYGNDGSSQGGKSRAEDDVGSQNEKKRKVLESSSKGPVTRSAAKVDDTVEDDLIVAAEPLFQQRDQQIHDIQFVPTKATSSTTTTACPPSSKQLEDSQRAINQLILDLDSTEDILRRLAPLWNWVRNRDPSKRDGRHSRIDNLWYVVRETLIDFLEKRRDGKQRLSILKRDQARVWCESRAMVRFTMLL